LASSQQFLITECARKSTSKALRWEIGKLGFRNINNSCFLVFMASASARFCLPCLKLTLQEVGTTTEAPKQLASLFPVLRKLFACLFIKQARQEEQNHQHD